MKKILFLLIFAFTILSGCSDSTSKVNENEDNSTQITNPFILPEDPSNQNQVASFGFGYGVADINFIYNGMDFTLPLDFQNSKIPTNIGTFIFIDGIAQEYSIDDNPTRAILHTLNLSANEEKQIEFSLAPTVTKQMEWANMHVVTMLDPTYTPSEAPYSFGVYHSILPIIPAKITFNTSPQILNPRIYEGKSPELITENIKSKYSIKTNTMDDIKLYQQDMIDPAYYVMDNNSLDFKLIAYGNNGGNRSYRVSFYINHQMVKFNNEFDYLDIEIKDGYITELDINVSDINNSDFCYAIAVPIDFGADLMTPIKLGSKMIFSSEFIESNISGNSSSEISLENNDINYNIIGADEDNIFSWANIDGCVKLLTLNMDLSVSNSKTIEDIQYIQKAKVFNDEIGILYFNPIKEIFVLDFFDKEYNQIQSFDLSEITNNRLAVDRLLCDFNQTSITYIGDIFNEYELWYADLKQKSKKIIAKFTDEVGGYGFCAFTDVVLCGEYIAFTAKGQDVNTNPIHFVGTCNIDGNNFNFKHEQGKSNIQSNGDSTIWWDEHLPLGKASSGEILLYHKGKYITVKTTTLNESQFGSISDTDNTIIALNSAEDLKTTKLIMRIYKDGNYIKEITIRDGYHISSLIASKNSIVVNLYNAEESIIEVFRY